MLNATAAALSNHLITRFPADRSYKRSDLDVLPLPVAHYLGSVLNRKAVSSESPWLDTNHEVSQTAGKSWEATAHGAAQFPAEAWENAVRTASRQVLRFLVEPVETLVSFVYTDASSPLEVDTVHKRMSAFSPYPYFHEVAEGYVKRKALHGIDKSEFDKLLTRIDKRMVARFGTSEWMTLLEPLFNLVEAIPGQEDGVSAVLLRQFFEAKGRGELASRLKGLETYNEDQLRVVLNSPMQPELVSKGEPSEDSAAASEQQAEKVQEEGNSEPLWHRLARDKATTEVAAGLAENERDINSIERRGDMLELNGTEGAAGLEDAGQAENGPLAEDTVNAKEAKANTDLEVVEENAEDIAEPPDTETENKEPEMTETENGESGEPLWRQFAGSKRAEKAAEPLAAYKPRHPDKAAPTHSNHPEPLQRLETRVLGPTATERRDWYAQPLTRGSEPAYRAVLEELDRAKNWNEAWPILKEVYQANNVDIYSDAIVAFTDAVETRHKA